jgi:hypothetical protein
VADLSPAAQAIVAAFDDRYELLGPLEGNWQEVCIAAALRAAADRVIDGRCQNESEKRIYDRLHRIATELDLTP